ncbi:MAG TPA: CsbD family protein [Thermoleophilaceae bacterium]|nr:CsbD family protein [Actinomycetota bacterium]HYN50611.1 CsbD family protein [Thermoleophilaceae bacterium]
MSIFDKITGRAKKAAGDITGDGSMRAEGRREERKGEEKEKLAEAQDRVVEKSQDVADLERRT